MLIYQIRLGYTTGDSFRSHEEESTLEYEWKDLEIAKENLQRIKKHYKWFLDDNYKRDSWKKTMPDFCVKSSTYGSSKYDYSILLKSEGGIRLSSLSFLVWLFWAFTLCWDHHKGRWWIKVLCSLGNEMITVSYEEFKHMIEVQVETTIKNVNYQKNRRIKLAIDMLENGLDKSSVIKILNKALED